MSQLAFWRSGSTRVLPGFGLSMGISVLFISLVLLLPITGLFGQLSELSLAEYFAIITEGRVVASYMVTIGAAAVAALVNAVFGLLLAWVLVRYEFPGKRLIDAVVDLPFALPTAVYQVVLAGNASTAIPIAFTPAGRFVLPPVPRRSPVARMIASVFLTTAMLCARRRRLWLKP